MTESQEGSHLLCIWIVLTRDLHAITGYAFSRKERLFMGAPTMRFLFSLKKHFDSVTFM